LVAQDSYASATKTFGYNGGLTTLIVIAQHRKYSLLGAQLTEQLGARLSLYLDLKFCLMPWTKVGNGDEVTSEDHDIRVKLVD
jgi:hypothetical protein